MDSLKKAGIITGAVVGGVVGGTVAVVGSLCKNKYVEGLGSNIVDSTIMTGEIAGTAASGAAHLAAGAVKKDKDHSEQGKSDLKDAGGAVVENFKDNVRLTVRNGGEIVRGVRQKDKARVVKGLKTLGKAFVIAAVTTGAVKTDEMDETKEPQKQQDTGEGLQ